MRPRGLLTVIVAESPQGQRVKISQLFAYTLPYYEDSSSTPSVKGVSKEETTEIDHRHSRVTINLFCRRQSLGREPD